MIITSDKVKKIQKMCGELSSGNSDVFISGTMLEVVSVLPLTNYFRYILSENDIDTFGVSKKLKIKQSMLLEFFSLIKNNEDLWLEIENGVLVAKTTSSAKRAETSNFSIVDLDYQSIDNTMDKEHPDIEILNTLKIAVLQEHKVLFLGNTKTLSNINGIFLDNTTSYSTNQFSILKKQNNIDFGSFFIPSDIFNFCVQNKAALRFNKEHNRMSVDHEDYVVVMPYSSADEKLFKKLSSISDMIDTSSSPITLEVQKFLSIIDQATIKSFKSKNVLFEICGTSLTVSIETADMTKYSSNIVFDSPTDFDKVLFKLPADELYKMLGVCKSYTEMNIYPHNDRLIAFEFGNNLHIIGVSTD
jgi:hypothetical protein